MAFDATNEKAMSRGTDQEGQMGDAGNDPELEGYEARQVRIPTQSGHRFRFDAGHRSEMKPAVIPR
jgi:hypothetical protein